MARKKKENEQLEAGQLDLSNYTDAQIGKAIRKGVKELNALKTEIEAMNDNRTKYNVKLIVNGIKTMIEASTNQE